MSIPVKYFLTLGLLLLANMAIAEDGCPPGMILPTVQISIHAFLSPLGITATNNRHYHGNHHRSDGQVNGAPLQPIRPMES